MDLSTPPRRVRPESIVPMINVVFLLLVFFLMTATIAPPEPFDVAPPESDAESEPERGGALYLDAAGQVAWSDLRGAEAIGAVAAARAGKAALEPLVIHADRSVEAARLARLLADLAVAGVREIQLVTEPSP